MAAVAILFSKDLSQKIIRSAKIPRKQPYQIWKQSNKRFISYRAHKLFGRLSWKMEVFGSVPPKKYIYMGRIALSHRSDMWKMNKMDQLPF